MMATFTSRSFFISARSSRLPDRTSCACSTALRTVSDASAPFLICSESCSSSPSVSLNATSFDSINLVSLSASFSDLARPTSDLVRRSLAWSI